jgi:hypothetical protein
MPQSQATRTIVKIKECVKEKMEKKGHPKIEYLMLEGCLV